ncbi:ribonuclease J [uncultured Ezakiella sp.]|uniref:ribonuclease J n=1 Tax=uncultured Ezakiella sp. TaxID=1637529 RepID=UPI0025EBECB1|nr:ribonuclease J [uncultured Ezakiella sp.]
MSNGVKIIPLGGLKEIGKNITAYEYKDQIVVIDCGMTFPGDEMLGIDIVIPDVSYLIENKHKVKAFFITHGHEDHIGAIPYVLSQINAPIYATKLTCALIRNKVKEFNLALNINEVNYGDVVDVGAFKAEFVAVTHSIPDSAAIALYTPVGTVFQTGDFKIDLTPIDGVRPDLTRIAEIGKKGVSLLLADSTNVERQGHTLSESTIGDTFNELFSKADGRILVATFASNVHRVQQIIAAAEKHDRFVALSGRSMLNVANTAIEMGYIKIKEKTLIDINQAHNYPPNKVCIVMTGSQGEPMSALTRIANDEHKKIKLTNKDTVIISANPIPGNEKSITAVINNLMAKDATVIYDKIANIHVSGHACADEIKLMHALVKPKFFMPVHGEIKHLKTHALLAQEMGMDKKNIFVQSNGDVLELTKRSLKVVDHIANEDVLVDGLGVGDVGNIVLRDRKHLSEDGLIVVTLTLSADDGRVLAGPDIISRGFVYVKESEDIMESLLRKLRSVVQSLQDRGIDDWNTMKTTIRDELRKYLMSTTGRNPMILTIFTEV